MPPKKDPNKPKGRTSAYAFYVKHRREHYKKIGEEVAFTDFSRQCSENWKKMDDSDKAKFFKMAEEDRQRYDTEMGAYIPPDSAGKKGKRRRNKKQKDPNQPKRAMSAFMWFAQEQRPKLKKVNPSATVGETAKKLGAQWQGMSEEEKAPYLEQQKKDRQRYERDMAAYRAKGATAVGGDEEEEEEEEEDYSEED